jgi:hypothetical protein
MSRGIFWAILLSSIFGLLALSFLVLIPMILESPAALPWLERRASSAMGRPVLIQGPVRIGLMPRIQIQVSGIRVLAPEGFPEKELLRVDSALLEASIGQLLKDPLRPRSITIRGLTLAMQGDGQGRFGWPQAQLRTPRAPKTQESGSPDHLSLPLSFPGILLGTRLEILDASMLRVDRSGGTHLEIRALDFQLGDPSPDGFQAVSLKGDIRGRSISVQGKLRPDPEGGHGAGEKVSVQLESQLGGNLRATVAGELQTKKGTPGARLRLELEPFSPRSLLPALGLHREGAFPSGWSQVSLWAELVVSPGLLEIPQAELRADQSLFRLSMALRMEPKARVELNLETESLDLDRYFPTPPTPRRRRNSSESGSHEPLKQPSETPAVHKLLGIQWEGSAKIHRLALRGQQLEDVRIFYRFLDRVLYVDDIRINLEGGELWGSGSVEFQGSSPHVHLDLNTRHVQVGPLLEKLARTKFLDGTMQSNWSLDGPWEGDLDRAGQTWQGEADVVLSNGAINGVDLGQLVRSLGLASKEQVARAEARTAFSTLVAHVALAGGSVRVSKASMHARELRILAAGQANLVDKSLDFRLEPELGQQERGEDTAALVVPIWVHGSFSHPKFRADLAGIRKKGEGKLHLTLPSPRELKETLRNFLKGR